MAQIWPKSRPKLDFFCYLLKFGSLVFFEIAYNDSLKECLTFSRGKIHENSFLGLNFGQIGQNQVFCHFLKFGTLVFF